MKKSLGFRLGVMISYLCKAVKRAANDKKQRRMSPLRLVSNNLIALYHARINGHLEERVYEA